MFKYSDLSSVIKKNVSSIAFNLTSISRSFEKREEMACGDVKVFAAQDLSVRIEPRSVEEVPRD
jgi:hypothetical protein